MDKRVVTALRQALQGFLEEHAVLAKGVCPCLYCVKGHQAIHNVWLQSHK